MQYLHVKEAFCRIDCICMYAKYKQRYRQHTLPQCILEEWKYQRWKHLPNWVKHSANPPCQKYFMSSEKALKIVSQVSRIPRQDPHPLLKPALVFAIDFYCQGWVAGFLNGQNRLSNLAVLQGSASQRQLMNFAAAIWEQMGSFHGNTHTGTLRKWKLLPPAAFPQAGTGWVDAHWHIQTGSLWVANYSWRTQAFPSLWIAELMNGGKPGKFAFPGQAASGWGVMHHKWELNLLSSTGVIFS